MTFYQAMNAADRAKGSRIFKKFVEQTMQNNPNHWIDQAVDREIDLEVE